MTAAWTDELRTLLEAPAPAVFTTFRKDGSVLVSPVWFRWTGRTFDVVVARDDVKIRHLRCDPRCVFVVFETVVPFRGIEVRTEPEIVECDVTEARAEIAGRYLGAELGARFAETRRSLPGYLLRLEAAEPRTWNLAGIVPSGGD